MSYIITGATLLGYNHQNNFLSDAFRINSTKNYTVEGFFLQTNNASGVSGNLFLESGLIRSLNEREEIIVNNINLGPARINSINFDTNNPIRLSKYTINFDILSSGKEDFYNLTGNLYTGISGALSGTAKLLENFEENFNFNITEDNSYNYTHNLNIRYRKADGYESPIKLAKNLASGIFADLPNLGFIDSKYSGFYIKSGKKFFTENYNLITNDCSFGKTFNLFNNYSGDYTLSLNQTFNFGNDGNIEVSEQANIKGLVEDRFITAKNAVETELKKSYTRCSNIFNAYKNSNQLTNSYGLINTGIEITKNYNAFNGEAQYSVRYTNNPIFSPIGYTKDTTLVLNERFGVVDVQENGSIRVHGSKTASFSFPAISTILSAAAGNVNLFYSNQGYGNTLTLVEKNLSFPNYGQALTYSLKYSDDNIYFPLVQGVKKLIIKKSDQVPKNMYQEYIIPNVKTFKANGNQTELGSRAVTIECTIDRPSSNIFLSNPITSIVNLLKGFAVGQIGKDFPKVKIEDGFVTECSYTFNSDLNLNFNLTMNYTSDVTAFDSSIKL